MVAVSVRGVARGACVEVTRASDATTGRRAEENAEKAKTGGGEPAKRLEGRFDRPIGGEQTRFIGTRWVNGCRPDASIIFLSDWRGALKKRSAGKTHSRRGRPPFRGDRRAHALLIRTMVSPNATDDPESAEKQPEVRALYDRRAPLDERGRASPAFLVTTFSLARGAVATFRPPSISASPSALTHPRCARTIENTICQSHHAL